MSKQHTQRNSGPPNFLEITVFLLLTLRCLSSGADPIDPTANALWDPVFDSHSRLLQEPPPGTPPDFNHVLQNNNAVKTYINGATKAFQETISGIKNHEFLIYFQQTSKSRFVDFGIFEFKFGDLGIFKVPKKVLNRSAIFFPIWT